jgi:hypothetical protein
MARARRAQAQVTQSGNGGFSCPECGRSFATAAALGSHRRRAHGVAGTSRTATGSSGARRSRRSGRASTAAAAPRTGGATATTAQSRAGSRADGGANGTGAGSAPRASSSRRRRRPTSPAPRRSPTRVNRDALLQSLFPAGIPAREEVIRAVNAWLDEAERLAALA